MLAKVVSCAVQGLEGALVEVEVDVANGLPSFTLVGLPDTAVQEARERVRAAIKNSGAVFPMSRKVVVNLAPADIKKEGPSYDLPIALGVLLATQQVIADIGQTMVIGELSLDGAVRHIEGVLPMVSVAREQGIGRVFVPSSDASEAALLEGVEVIPIATLGDLIRHLREEQPIAAFTPDRSAFDLSIDDDQTNPNAVDFAQVKGNEHVKRALEVAAAGGHNVLLSGPPGSGKTLLARAMVAILPKMTVDEALTVTKIYSVNGMLPADTPLMRQRPFRSPHHSISHAGLVGGGRIPHPGEISLAHRGVLFLDEIPEFNSNALEALRQPLEDKVVTISRVNGSLTFPANFILVGAMNPCPCGYFGDSQKSCTCSAQAITRYQKRLSGPLMDRIDIHVQVPRVDYEKLSDARLGETSAKVRERVQRAREVQAARFKSREQVIYTNAEMGPAEIRDFCALDASAEPLMRAAMKQMHLSARGYHRVLKLARTIADLVGAKTTGAAHLAEALQYRPREVL